MDARGVVCAGVGAQFVAPGAGDYRTPLGDALSQAMRHRVAANPSDGVHERGRVHLRCWRRDQV